MLNMLRKNKVAIRDVLLFPTMKRLSKKEMRRLLGFAITNFDEDE